MTKKLIFLTVLALSGCAAANNSDEADQPLSSIANGPCFDRAAVNNFNVRDKRILYVSTRQHYVYRLDTEADCFSRGTVTVAVGTFAGSGGRICPGGQTAVALGQFRGGGKSQCIASVSGPIADSKESGLGSRLSR